MHGGFILRVCLTALTAVLGAAGWEASRLGAAQSAPSLLLSATPLLAWLGALLAAFAAVSPARRLEPLRNLFSRRAEPFPSTDERGTIGPAVLTSIAIGVFLVAAAASLRSPGDPKLDDQEAYIELARDIRRHGGSPMLWYRMQTGKFSEANRHPLYPLLLSYRPTAEAGRLLSLGIAILTAALCGLMIRRRFGALTAAIFLLLLACNRSFVGYATSVVCEPLMILVGGLAWLALVPPRDAQQPTSVLGRLLVASAWLGVMYLTKATGLLFFGVYLVWLAWQARPRSATYLDRVSPEADLLPPDAPYQLRRQAVVLACSAGMFLMIAHPLIVRNVRLFGNPFHNVNSLLLFADSYSEFDEMLLTNQTTSQAARHYLATHTFGDMVSREASGLAWETFIMLRSLGPHGLDDARVLFGMPLALCCLASLLSDPRPASSLLFAWIFACGIVFAWYVPIAAGDRFPIPLLIPVLAHAARGIVLLIPQRSRPVT